MTIYTVVVTPIRPLRSLPQGLLSRAGSAARVAQGLGLLAAHGLHSGADPDADEAEQGRIGGLIAAELDRMKGLGMKVGQILSTMDAGLPPAVQAALSRLQRGARPMEPAALIAVVEAAFDQPLASLFDDFEREPVASASIGQVHRARLRGEEVAVKIRYPGIWEAIEADAGRLGSFAALASLGSAVDGRALLSELRTRLHEECDYRIEAQNTAEARACLLGDRVLIPALAPDRCAEAVLTTRWCDGEPLSARTVGAVAEPLLALPWRGLFAHSLMHADPHPGNFLAQGSTLVVLDWGCLRRFNEEERESTRALLRAWLHRDRPAFAENIERAGLAPDPRRYDMGAAWALFDWLLAPYRPGRFRFGPEWSREALRHTGPRAPNQRSQGIPPAWIWLLRTTAGLHGALARWGAEGDFHSAFSAALEQPLRRQPAQG